MKLILLLFTIPLLSFSQIGCGGQFYDNGGILGDYLPNSNQVVTICPSIPGEVVTVTFTSFDTEVAHDGLYIYNGNVNAPLYLIASTNPAGSVPGGLAGSFWGSTLPGPFTSTSLDGCLTFAFRSDNAVENSGWIANVTCEPPIVTSGFQIKAFLDLNSNGNQDVGELNFPFGEVVYQVNGGIPYYIYYYNGIGYVQEYNATNSYDFAYFVDPAYSTLYNVTTPSYSGITIGTGSGLVPVNFPITALVNYSDLAVNVIPIFSPRAGFNYVNRLSYTNFGNQTIANGSLTFSNDAAITIISTSDIVTTTSTGFAYNFSNLLPFETRFIDVTMSVPSIPTVSIGQLLNNSASISTPVTETTLSNNNSTLNQAIVASYDPNDITESHGEEIVYSTFAPNDYLTYTIRFENTGTAPATNVLVTDVLDSEIDETSIKMISASDNYILERVGNILSWKFDNIELPVSVSGTTIGNGYITFKAKLKPGFVVGSIIPNMAKIYFDSNPAIDTNTFNTEFVATLANSNFSFDNYFSIYPNPVTNVLNISTKQEVEISSISLYNTLGQLLQTILNQTKTIDVSELQRGSYFIKIISNKGTATGKFIKR